MKPNRLILTIVVLTICLFLYAGCQEESMQSRQELSADWFRQFDQIRQSGQIQQANQPRSTKRSTTSSRRTAPKMEFEQLVHDFGVVGPGTNNECEFKFTNTGKSTLRIEDIESSCGCTPFTLAKNEYAPGESGTLKVNYFSEQQRGQTTKELVIHSNDRTNPETTLTVKANIRILVDYEPKMLNLLLKKENADCPELTLTSVDGRPFSITSFKSTANCVTADFDPTQQATKFVLQPKVDMATLEKTSNGHIEIGLTHPECKTVSVAIHTLPKFKIAPRSIVVRGSNRQEPIVKKLRILSNYDEDFQLDTSWSSNGIVKVVSNSIVRNGYELELEIKPPTVGDKKRILSETFYVKTKDGQQLEIPCNVYYSRAIPKSLKTEEDEECKVCGHHLLDFNKGTDKVFPVAD